jgi:hypothetical protein
MKILHHKTVSAFGIAASLLATLNDRISPLQLQLVSVCQVDDDRSVFCTFATHRPTRARAHTHTHTRACCKMRQA